jgi:hypothetical protein
MMERFDLIMDKSMVCNELYSAYYQVPETALRLRVDLRADDQSSKL